MKKLPKLAASTLCVALFMSTKLQAAGSGFEMMEDEPEASVLLYNQGVELMLLKNFAEAEDKFREALRADDSFAKAHNNLAYTLRKQGEQHYSEALLHYSRAVQLSPELPEPYMYRGVLLVQMGNDKKAHQDHAMLEQLHKPLADELAYVIENRREKQPEQFFGVSMAVE